MDWILELLWQWGICYVSATFQNCSDIVVFFCFSARLQNYSDIVVFFVFLLDFRIVLILWYLLFFCQTLELFRHCVFFLLYFRIVLTLWYLLFFCQTLELLRHCIIFCFSVRLYNCSDILVFVVFLLDFRIDPTLWYYFFCQILELF